MRRLRFDNVFPANSYVFCTYVREEGLIADFLVVRVCYRVSPTCAYS